MTTMLRDTTVPLTRNHHLLRWVETMKELTRPARVHWVDGSQEENDTLLAEMQEAGTLQKLYEE
jgi:phosphoenolpyruvate carboxykinase (GTP)